MENIFLKRNPNNLEEFFYDLEIPINGYGYPLKGEMTLSRGIMLSRFFKEASSEIDIIKIQKLLNIIVQNSINFLIRFTARHCVGNESNNMIKGETFVDNKITADKLQRIKNDTLRRNISINAPFAKSKPEKIDHLKSELRSCNLNVLNIPSTFVHFNIMKEETEIKHELFLIFGWSIHANDEICGLEDALFGRMLFDKELISSVV